MFKIANVAVMGKDFRAKCASCPAVFTSGTSQKSANSARDRHWREEHGPKKKQQKRKRQAADRTTINEYGKMHTESKKTETWILTPTLTSAKK